MHRSTVTIQSKLPGRFTGPLAAFLLWAIVSVGQAAADAQPLILEHLGTADGLPQGSVLSTLQDSQGFIWLGTEDGLVRYDGHQLVRYAHLRSVSDGLPGDFIYQIVEDARNDLWIAIKDTGVARWNRRTDTFTSYRHDVSNPDSLASDAARSVMLDARGLVWIGTSDAGIDVLDPASGLVRHLRHQSQDPRSLADDRIFTLMLDRAGSVWVGTAAGLDRWQDEAGGFRHYTVGGRQISRIFEDRGGMIWVASYDGGLYRIDRDGGSTQSFRHDAQQTASLSSDDVRALLEDQSGNLWVGTTDALDLFDPASSTFTHYVHQNSDVNSLSDSFVLSLYQDSTGLVWIGTKSGGVSRWNPRSWELGGRRPAWLSDRLVTAFADAPNNKVWIASLGGGLFQFDSDSGQAVDLDTLTGRRNTLGDRRVMALHQDRGGTLWIGTMTHGLAKLSPSGQLASIPVKLGDNRSLSDSGIMTLFEARDGHLWIGTHDGGLNVLDPVTGLIRQLPHDSSTGATVSAASVTSIAEDAHGNFWIGTDGGGLDLARADGSVVSVFRNDPNDPKSLPANTVYAIAIDAQERVWIGTDSGLAQVIGSPAAPASIHFDVTSRDQGLSSDAIWGVLTDASGRLWLSGNAGLMRLDSDSHRIKTYHREHGLQGEEFDSGAYFRLRDGRLCFGGPGGFNIFDPSRLSKDPPPPRLVLTGLDVLGVPAHTDSPYWLLQRISVDHLASIVSLDFAALDFNSPKLNHIAYRMTGLTERWIDLGSQHRVTLTNLDAGEHLLEVRAANADSVWSEPLRLTIRKTPAPWRSPIAYAAYAAVALSLVLERIRSHRRKFRRIVEARERLETEVALRTGELLHSNQQLAEAVRAKSDFLDRMSHELRTPMNGVVGMTELLSRTPLSSAQQRLTQTIRSSAEVLLKIVNDLLDLSKVQAGKVELESLPIDLLPLLEDSASLFAGAAEAKGIELIVCPAVLEGVTLVGDATRLRQIVMNLIGNAVKFTLHGEVRVIAEVLELQPGRARLQIEVSDTGIGMDAATIEKIFEPFTQADESTTRRFGGSGLGLSICRELANLLGGSISVESRVDVGTSFILSIPFATAVAGAPSSPRLPPRKVRIMTRRRALGECLSRHVAAFGLSIDAAEQTAIAADTVMLVDAGSCPEFLQSFRESAPWARPVLVAIASSIEVQEHRLAEVLGVDRIVQKPVHRQALYEALSAVTGQGAAARSYSAAATGAAAIGAHVLLVEDEPVNAAVARGYLAALGCTCVWVEDGAQAAARSAAEHFDLILMDLSMPNMDGFATTALIRQREADGSRVPIVALTAHDVESYRETCLKAGMNDLLTKPCTLQACEQMLRRWISEDRARMVDVPALRADNDALTRIDPIAVSSLSNLQSGSSHDLFAELVTLFEASSSACMAQLREAFRTRDFERAAAICHKLGSSAANVGAVAFAKDVRALGQRCVERDVRGAEQLHRRLQMAHPNLLQELTCMSLRENA